MKKTQGRVFSLLSLNSMVVGCVSAALSLSAGCSGNQGEDEQTTSSSSTGGQESSSTPDASGESSGAEDDTAPSEPTEKTVQLNLGELPTELEDLRIAVHPDLDFKQEGGKLGEALADIVVEQGKDDLVDLTVKPIAKDIDLGEAKVTLLYVSMYKDKDKSKSYTQGDVLLGSVVESLAYAREGNVKKLPEWTQVDIASGKLVEVNKALVMKRVDNLETIETLELPAKTEKIVEGAGLLALVSPKEAQDFSKNFSKEPRGEVLKVDRDKKEHTLKLSATPAKARQGSEALAYLPRFKNMSVNMLAGFKSDGDEVTKDSELMGLGCVMLEFNGKTVYDSLLALWIEPGEGWVSDPASAYEALVEGYRPGWNPLAIQTEEDGSLFAYRLGDEDMKLISVSKDCKVK